jgi:8-oxo-dGTP pyrophosphatase MutT (NUDIX family)
MISFDRGNARFNFRSAAVLIHDGHLLVHKDQRDDFWALPGGRVELFEHSDRTVLRELDEELGIAGKIVRPLWYVENFFDYAGRHYHEVATYYLTELGCALTISPNVEFPGTEQDTRLVFKWIPLADIPACHLKPGFLKIRLGAIQPNVEFIQIREPGA